MTTSPIPVEVDFPKIDEMIIEKVMRTRWMCWRWVITPSETSISHFLPPRKQVCSWRTSDGRRRGRHMDVLLFAAQARHPVWAIRWVPWPLPSLLVWYLLICELILVYCRLWTIVCCLCLVHGCLQVTLGHLWTAVSPDGGQWSSPDGPYFYLVLFPSSDDLLLYLVWSMTVWRWHMLSLGGHGSRTAVIDRPRTVH